MIIHRDKLSILTKQVAYIHIIYNTIQMYTIIDTFKRYITIIIWCVRTGAWVSVGVWVCVCVCVCVCVRVRVHACVRFYESAHVCVYAFVCVRTCSWEALRITSYITNGTYVSSYSLYISCSIRALYGHWTYPNFAYSNSKVNKSILVIFSIVSQRCWRVFKHCF